MIDINTPTNTEVVVTNDEEPFYLARGTVAGPSRKPGRLPVRFAMKPHLTYDVPVEDLDLYIGQALYPALPEGKTVINGAPSLAAFMNEHARTAAVKRWAFAGSVALKVWADSRNLDFRTPNDMDVVVDNLLGAYVTVHDAVVGGRVNPPGPNSDHRTVELDMFTLDIIADGKGLGDTADGVHIVNGIPVVSVENIRRYKTKRGQPKDIQDLDFIRQHLS
jgi:hypothetical protein